MIKNYGIYNNHELDNTLLILFSDKGFNDVKKLSEEMEVLYNNDTLIGYRISNFIRYAKIKYSGIIFLPAPQLIDIINNVIERYNLEKLEYKTSSGYITKMNENKLMVFALNGTFLRDQTVSNGKYVSYYELYINDEKDLIVIDENIKENIDFFKTEAR